MLHGFGLSLLVPDEHYAAVAEWVDRTRLDGRLVYFRVRSASRPAPADPHRDALARKLAVKPDSPFCEWLQREIAHRFDVACCTTPEQFRHETRAITRAGQIKAPGGAGNAGRVPGLPGTGLATGRGRYRGSGRPAAPAGGVV
jgi:uncharacterized protein YPO0396